MENLEQLKEILLNISIPRNMAFITLPPQIIFVAR